jgi:transposase
MRIRYSFCQFKLHFSAVFSNPSVWLYTSLTFGVEEYLRPLAAYAPNLCPDKAYDFDEVRELQHRFGLTAPIRRRGEEARAIARKAGYRARRWVVERTHSGMERFCRLLIRWEKKPENYIGPLHFGLPGYSDRLL